MEVSTIADKYLSSQALVFIMTVTVHKKAGGKVPLIHSCLAPAPSLLPDLLHGLLAALLWGPPLHSRPFCT